MIRGVVNARDEAVVRIRVRGPAHPGLDVDLVIDSGFTESLAMPASMIAALGLVRHSTGVATMADGSSRSFDVHAAEVSWDGGWRPALAYDIGGEAPLGMRLLAGHELRIAVVPGGPVEITRLP